jgi:Phage Mu protein F like protein
VAKPAAGEKNIHKLPRGDRLRREVVAVFRSQRRAILRFLKTGRKAHAAGPLPAAWPDWHDFGAGALDLADRMAPLLSLTWDAAGSKFLSKIGLDPDAWDVTNPHLARVIDEAALAFCDSMNATTSKSLDVALAETRAALHEGVVKEGESVEQLTKRINAIFDGAERWRARRIAQTETSRAVHAAQEAAAIQSGVVTGWEWLLSGDACPMCVAIAARARFVRLGHAFAVIGENPHYSQVKFPPAHPHCNCTVNEVLDTDEQPAWSDTLHQPEPATEEEHAAVAAITQARDEEVLKPKPARPPKPPKPPAAAKPPAAIRPPKPAKPAPAPKPAKPVWKPGEAIDPDRPIGERIAAAEHLEAKRKAIVDVGGRASAAIAALEARKEVLRMEAEQFTRELEARGVHDPMEQLRRGLAEIIARHDQVVEELLERKKDETDRVRREVGEVLGLAKGDRAAWKHTDGPGFRWKMKNKNVATRAESSAWLASLTATGPGAAPIEIKWESRPEERAYANKGKKLIVVKDGESASTMVHEMGHHVEFRLPGAQQAAQDFLRHRVKDQPLTSLRQRLGKNYRADEMGRDDDFARAFGARGAWYVGKHYEDGSTEIISMAVEKLYNDPVGFAKNDPEYCKFILGILDGSMRTPAP